MDCGITHRKLSAWLGRSAIDREVRQPDGETARETYVTRYLTGPRIDTLPPESCPKCSTWRWIAARGAR